MNQNCKKNSTKPVHLNPFVHKQLKIAAAKRDLKVAEYANVLLGRALGIVPDVDVPVADLVKGLDAMEIEEQSEPVVETADALVV